jgi:farnesyl diphosphate synthase
MAPICSTNLAELLETGRAHIDRYLSAQIDALPDCAPKLKAAMRHGLLLGGKRVRPLLVYLSGALNGATMEQLDPVAASLEAIHAYSLIHDDLPAMDDDALRRGQPTCHIAFDEATAILAGDALQSFAFEQITQIKGLDGTAQIELVRQLSKAAGYQGMCGGQALDMAATNQAVTLNELEAVHRLKTGALIQASVMMGAIAAGINKSHELCALSDYAGAIGLAFQVQDDILDIISDTYTLGKPQGSDLAANKSTYPALLGLEGAQKKASALFDEALSALTQLPYHTQPLADLAGYIVNRIK